MFQARVFMSALSSSARALAIFNFCLCLLALIPVIFAFLVFFTTPSLRQSQQNYLFISFLTTALLYIFLGMIFSGHNAIYNNFELLIQNCAVYGLINQFCATMEVYSLAALAIERYFAIVRQRRLTKNEIIGLIGFGWIDCLVLAS